jgi:sphingomyelin phosphodiesterase acid-like 3
MKGNRAECGFRAVAGRCILLSGLFLPCCGVVAQNSQATASQPAPASQQQPGAQAVLPAAQPAAGPAALPGKETIPALFLSDIHFEPFWDPGKVSQLAAAPVSAWNAILAAPPSADRQQRFAALQQTCPTRGEDTSYPLLESSLRAVRAMQAGAAGARFATVSGDLIAHAFDCKYSALFPHSSPGDYRAFVEKTLNYVIEELGGALPGVPVYVALGNNDSDCGDYRLDAHSEFLSDTGREVAKGFPASERQDAEETFAAGGYYSVALPAPIDNTRLLVLNDLFMSSKYSTCAGKADTTAAEAQLGWLQKQLTEARGNKRKVWVMGHIPPEIYLHGTVAKMRDVCGGARPEMFLSSERMADELVEFSDVVELAIFAHTHMDEARILKADSDASPATAQKSVAVKMVPSISPIDGNAPSFTVARINPSSAALVDYRVFAASNQTGVNAAWKEEYDYGRTYHQAAFSAAAVSQMIAGFQADPGAMTDASRAYMRNFFVGDASPLLKLVWPQYVCSLSNHSAEGFKSCMCPAAR